MGRGSLDFAIQLVADNLPEEPTPASDLPWCQWRVCLPMETEQENVCCKKRQCITSYRAFNNICLDRDILEVCNKARCDIRADGFNFSMESFRKAAYRQFALWKYGKLGRGNRQVLPSCTVRMIPQAYPSPDGRYMGFRNDWADSCHSSSLDIRQSNNYSLPSKLLYIPILPRLGSCKNIIFQARLNTNLLLFVNSFHDRLVY